MLPPQRGCRVGDPGLGDEVILGQTVLEKLDVLADCARQRLVPNPEHPDQPVSKIR